MAIFSWTGRTKKRTEMRDNTKKEKKCFQLLQNVIETFRSVIALKDASYDVAAGHKSLKQFVKIRWPTGSQGTGPSEGTSKEEVRL